MGNNTSVYTDVTVKDDIITKRKFVNDKLEYKYSFPVIEKTKVYFSDLEWQEIKEQGYKDIEFCILDNGSNGISECMGLFDYPNNERASELDQYSVTKGQTPCRGYYYRPGLVYDEKNDFNVIERELGRPEQGKLCRIVFQDYNYNDADMDRCCFSDNKNKCNANLINEYTTTHCNATMEKMCVGNETNPKCIKWLENTNKRNEDIALSFYQDFCSKNFDSMACGYLCKVARENEDYQSGFCDTALQNYCQQNQFDSKCFCVMTPTTIVPDLETYLGPKECWLSACASQRDSKWLTTTQIDTREKCNLTSCIISIDDLTLKNKSKAELINDCVSGTSVNSSYKLDIEGTKKAINIDSTPGVLFYPSLGLLTLTFILLLK
ncbi:putative myristylated protein entry-fusion complex component [Yalta virus]|nr:putative myristylated protein entry-fusion complex component [Yalta virus]